MISLGSFGFVGGADDGKELFAVALELCRSDPTNLGERCRCSRTTYRDLGQSTVGKDDVRRDLLLLRNRAPHSPHLLPDHPARPGHWLGAPWLTP